MRFLINFSEFIEKRGKIMEDEIDSQFKGHRDINQDEKENHFNNKLSILTIQEKIKTLNLDDVMMDFDASSLYPCAMWDEQSVSDETIESGFSFKPHLNDVYLETFNNPSWNQVGKESAVLTIEYYSPSKLIFQLWPVKGKVKNLEVNRMRNCY